MLRVRVRPALAICAIAAPLFACAQVDVALDRLGLREAPDATLTESALATKKSSEADKAAVKPPAKPRALPMPKVTKPSTIMGTGRFINRPAATPEDRTGPENGDLTLSFVDTDVREVVRAVLGDMLKLNFVIDPKVQGIVTLQTTKPIPMQDALPTLESVLRLNNFAVVEANGIYTVLPVEAAARSDVIPRLKQRSGSGSIAFGVQIVPLRHISATEMTKILEPFAPKGAILRTDAARNLLLLAGTRNERRSMTEIVEIFDVDWFTGMSFALVPLRYSEAAAVAEDLEKVFAGGSEDTPAVSRQV